MAWLERHPCWIFHFTPTSGSWLNAVENFFSTLTRQPPSIKVVHRQGSAERPAEGLGLWSERLDVLTQPLIGAIEKVIGHVLRIAACLSLAAERFGDLSD